MLHLISMKSFEGHLGINWSTEKKFDDAISHMVQQQYCLKKKKNLQHSYSLKQLNRERQNITGMTAYS